MNDCMNCMNENENDIIIEEETVRLTHDDEKLKWFHNNENNNEENDTQIDYNNQCCLMN